MALKKFFRAIALFLGVLVMCAATASGQTTLPDAPSIGNKLLLIEAGADASAIVFDDITTQRFERMGCVEVWSPALYGTHPSNARFYGASFGIEGGELLASHYLLKSNHRVLHVAAHLLVNQDTYSHLSGGIHNLHLTPEFCGGGR